MKLQGLRWFNTDGDLEEGCFIMCPTCGIGRHHKDWNDVGVCCPHCDCVIAIECPECGAVHCADHGPTLLLCPPFGYNVLRGYNDL